MRRHIRLLITILCIIICCLVAGMFYLIVKGDLGFNYFSYSRSDAKLISTTQLSVSDIDNINVSYKGDVIFYQGDSDKLVIDEYSVKDLEEDKKVQIDSSGDTITVEAQRDDNWSSGFWFFVNESNYRYLKVYLPASYSGSLVTETVSGDIISDDLFSLDDIALTTVSGDIRMEQLEGETIELHTTSGDVSISQASGERIIKTTSGDIKVLSGDGDSLFTSTSGDITAENASGNMVVKTASGDIRVLKSAVSGTFNTTSGDILVEVSNMIGSIDFTSVSGDVKCIIPENAELIFEANTTSGDINTFFDEDLSYNKRRNHVNGSIGDSPDIRLTVDTASGDMNISKK